MVLGEAKRDRIGERRAAVKAEILAAAWQVAAEVGLASLTLQQVARAVGMRPPSLYNYFESKAAIYDAMFAEGAQQFADREPWDEVTGDARHDVALMLHTFIGFCVEHPARYQLLFQRTIPDFEPSPASFAISEASLGRVIDHLASCGIDDEGAIDLFTALGTGLASQQIANDPGGDRWLRLVDDAAEMYLSHVLERGRRTQGATPP